MDGQQDMSNKIEESKVFFSFCFCYYCFDRDYVVLSFQSLLNRQAINRKNEVVNKKTDNVTTRKN